MKYFAGIVLLLMHVSCTGVNEYSDEPFFKTNFDNLAGWVPEQGLVYGNAYSGLYALGVDSANEYTVFWNRKFLELSSKTLSKVRISSFAKAVNAKNSACLVVSIDSGHENLFWRSIEFDKFKLKTHVWKKMETFIELPVISDSSAKISIYLWGKGNSGVLIDDLEIEFAI